MSSQVQRMIGPIFKVVCETCGRALAPSSVKKHKEKVCMTMPHDEVNKGTTETTAVDKERVEELPKEKTNEEVASSNTTSEETTFSKEARDHVKKTEESMVDAADNAEIYNHAKEVSQKVRERTKQRVMPGIDWLDMTLHLDDWFNQIGPIDEVKEVEEDDAVKDKEETEKQDVGETVEITAMTQELAPEDTPLPKTPFKLKQRDCEVCKLWFNSMIELMLHVVEVHGVETGGHHAEVFMMAEQLGNQQDMLEATKLQLDTVREENRQFKLYVSQTLMQDMLEGMRKIVRAEMEEKEKPKEKPKEKTKEDEVELIKNDKSKTVQEVEMLECPGCDYTTTNKQYMKTHMTKHKKKNSFNCTKCVKRFATEHSLKQHMESQHKETPRLPVGHSQWAQKRNGETLRCTKCPRDLKGETELNLHMKKDHSHKCMECGVVHDSRDTLIVHLREVHSIDIYVDWKCKSCHEIFNGSENLTKHKCPVQSTFQEVTRPVCRYWRQGWCREGEGCKFLHPQQQQQQQRPGVAQQR